MGRKLIFLDIDGTLTTGGSCVPPDSALEAIRGAQKKGNLVFICTGRNYGMLSPFLKYGFDGAVGSAGGYVECKGEVIYDCKMSEEQKHRVTNVLERLGIFYVLETKDQAYMGEEFREFLQNYRKENGSSELVRWAKAIQEAFHILPIEEYRGEAAYKIIIISDKKEALEEARELLGEEFLFCIQGEERDGFVTIELINRQFDKGRSVERVCEYLGEDIRETVAFGDSANDLEMIRTAGLGVCMANGCDELKMAADDICPSVSEDGLYHAFQKYELM